MSYRIMTRVHGVQKVESLIESIPKSGREDCEILKRKAPSNIFFRCVVRKLLLNEWIANQEWGSAPLPLLIGYVHSTEYLLIGGSYREMLEDFSLQNWTTWLIVIVSSPFWAQHAQHFLDILYMRIQYRIIPIYHVFHFYAAEHSSLTPRSGALYSALVAPHK